MFGIKKTKQCATIIFVLVGWGTRVPESVFEKIEL